MTRRANEDKTTRPHGWPQVWPRVWVPVALLLLAGLLLAGRARAEAVWQQKVDPWVQETAAAQGETEFLVVLAEQADLRGAAALAGKVDKGRFVYEQLTAVAQRTQEPLRALLRAQGVAHRAYWVSNMIWVRGDAALVNELARRPDVARLYANPTLPLDVMPAQAETAARQEAAAVAWNVAQINAPQVWARGITGEGVVIGGQDTGYDWTHPALQAHYRGWDGVQANHDYNWHDAIHSNNVATAPGNRCGFDSAVPCDDNGHGTHTMGTMVGDDGAGNQIGVAPGAQWIGCRNMEEGWGSPASYSECYEWFIAPYPQGGDPFVAGDPSRAPDVINNSWSCPAVEGCSDADILRDVVEAVRAAGIVTVHAAGNTGPACSSITTPAAIYDASLTIAATDQQDAIALFSGRGPVPGDSERPFKPDLAAPGVDVRSSLPGGGYGYMRGTSMAAPHVAAVVALLLDARPPLAGNVAAIEGALRRSAVPLTTNDGCGGDTATAVPNHTFGWGRVDATVVYGSPGDWAALTSRSYLPTLLHE